MFICLIWIGLFSLQMLQQEPPFELIPVTEVDYANRNNSDFPLLGNITDGLILENGEFFLADNSAKMIHHFDSEGVFMNSFGRAGRGPGEARSVESIAYNQDSNSLYVLDRMNSRINVFSMESKELSHTINIRGFGLSPISKLFTAWDKLYFLGVHTDNDMLIHEIKPEGTVEKSLGDYIDYSSFYASWNGKLQLGFLHASSYEDLMLVGLAAPNRFKLFDKRNQQQNEFHDKTLPVPWETHMKMTHNSYETTFYSMGISNLILNRQLFLFQWMEVVNPQGYQTTNHLELRNLSDGIVIYSFSLDDKFILGMSRTDDGSALLLIRDENYKYMVYRLIINT